jgi:hypothetical protein
MMKRERLPGKAGRRAKAPPASEGGMTSEDARRRMRIEDDRRDQSLNDSRLGRCDEPLKAQEFLKGWGGNFLQEVSLAQIHSSNHFDDEDDDEDDFVDTHTQTGRSFCFSLFLK